MGSDLVVFAVEGWRLALPQTSVRELIRAVAVSPLPGAPDGVNGVIDVRGEVLPVYDLAGRLGVPTREVAAADHMLICDTGARGVVVVRADRVLEIRPTDAPLRPTPAAPMVAGVMALPDGVVVLCDLGAFLSDGDAAQLAAALEGPK